MGKVSSVCLTAALLGFGFPSYCMTDVSKVPIVHYHAGDVSVTNCTGYSNNSHDALSQDLQTLYNEGFTVVPVYWLAQWSQGDRPSSDFPPWVVGITFSDGYDGDFTSVPAHPCNAYMPSMYSILSSFKQQHAELPWYSPHASSFVIASPVARLDIDDQAASLGYGGFGTNEFYNEWWWPYAQNSGLMEIYNHSVDHDHPSVSYAYDSALGLNVPIVSYDPVNPSYTGTGNFADINSYPEAHYEIVSAAAYIQSKIGVYPDLFMCPAGAVSSYLTDTYFPYYGYEHQTYAAFCGISSGDYLRRGANRWRLPLFQHNADYTTAEQFRQILLASLRGDERDIGKYYLKLLGRVGDSGGYGYWLSILRSTRCNDPNSVWSQLDSITSQFVWSQEFLNRGLSNSDYVAALYRGLLQREPDSGGWSYYTMLLDQGYSRETIRQYFVGSQEFYNTAVAPVLNESCAR